MNDLLKKMADIWLMFVNKMQLWLQPATRLTLMWAIIFLSAMQGMAQQKPTLPISSNAPIKHVALKMKTLSPKQLKQAEQTEIKLQLKSEDLTQAISGYVQLEIIHPKDSSSIDGWFRNIFPLQYFNLLPKKTSRLNFPVQAPADYEGAVLFYFTAFNMEHQIIGKQLLELDCQK